MRVVVAVSEATKASLREQPHPDVEVCSVGSACRDASVLWRRQGDRTAWLFETLEELPGLRWIHTDTTGVDRLPLAELARRGILVSNAREVHGPAVSEWALGAMLLAAKSLHRTVRRSDDREWSTRPSIRLRGRAVAILGLGAIGGGLAEACAGLGMTVVGVSGSGRAIAGVTKVHAVRDDWMTELERVDFLLGCLPLTHQTGRLVDAAVLSRLKPTAWFINVGRGETVDQRALEEALDSGRLGGAVLDAFEHEPLGHESPLWGRENVIVSPHASGATEESESLTRELFTTELGRFLKGQRPRNLVDLERGY